MSKTPTFSTIHELASGPKFHLACAQIDAVPLRASIQDAIDKLVRVKSPAANALAAHFQGALDRTATLRVEAEYHYQLKRIALALSLVELGDL